MRKLQQQLTEAVQHFQPLTAPYEVVEPFIRNMGNTLDAHIVHWFVDRLGMSVLSD